jgi:hypothetical protein
MLALNVQGRGGGHYIYQRLLEDAGGHKQMMVLPSTPSDCRSIEGTHAQLQRMDRAAAEARRAWQEARRGGQAPPVGPG